MYAAVLLPNFELQCALRVEPELGQSAVALIADTAAGTSTIFQVNAAADAAGVVVGMSLPQAQARCGLLAFRQRSPVQERVATAALLQTCERISPFLENTAPGCCTLDLRRNGRLDEKTYVEVAEFEGGVETLEPVLFRLRRALELLSRRLRADFVLAGTIEFVLELEDGYRQEHAIEIPAPTCEVEVLFRVLCTYLEGVQTKCRVNGFRLEAIPSTPRDHQAQLWGSSLRDPNAFSETLARLGGVVGNQRVGTPCRLPTHRPFRFQMELPRFEHDILAGRPKYSLNQVRQSSPVFPPMGMSLRRYRPPCRLTVKIQDGQPVYVRGPDLECEVRACAGPWRLDGNWWEEQAAWRWEEWDVEMARGGLYRLANHRQENWWMLGLYD